MNEDVGKMFLNYLMWAAFRAYCSVNLTKFNEIKEFADQNWFRWCRTWMGLKPSPYLAV